jgi:hypothetical protein
LKELQILQIKEFTTYKRNGEEDIGRVSFDRNIEYRALGER